MNKIKEIIKSKYFRNSGWIIGQQIFQMVIQLIVGILSARYLGPENYGELNYTASFVTFFLSITTLGMDGVIIKKIVDHPQNENCYIGTAMFLRFISSAVSICSVCLLVFILNPGEKIKLIIVFLQSFQLNFRAIQILDAWFQRYCKSKYVSIGKMVACVVVSTFKLYLLVTMKSIIWFAAAYSITDCIIALMEVFFYYQQGGKRLTVNYNIGKEILRESYHFIIAGLMTAIYSQMDRIMIGKMMSDINVGLYTTATAICGMWIFIPTAIITSIQPSIMEVKKTGNEMQYLRRLKQLYSFIIWLCIGVSSIVAFLSDFIVNVLYGEAYAGAAITLRIAIWFETFAMIGTARGIWVLCEKKNKYVKYYLGIGAMVNLILNFVLIPMFGIEGAAFATLLTQFTTSIIAPLLFKETRIHSKYVFEAFCFKW